MKRMFICSLLALAMLACGDPANGEENENKEPEVENQNPPTPTPKPEPKPEPEPAPAPNISKDVPECSIKEFTNWQTHFASGRTIGDFSGLCFNADRSGLIGVSNYQGTLWHIGFDGTRDDKHFLWSGRDMEGITLDAETNTIYLCDEEHNRVYCVPDGATGVQKMFEFNTGAWDDNSGLEGITYHDGYLYLANQSPARLFIYSLEHEAMALSFDADFMKECFSDLWFDTTNNTLWAVDAWGNEIVNFTIWGDFIARFKPSAVPWIEGICIDFENNKAWFACDSTGQLFSAYIVRNNQ